MDELFTTTETAMITVPPFYFTQEGSLYNNGEPTIVGEEISSDEITLNENTGEVISYRSRNPRGDVTLVTRVSRKSIAEYVAVTFFPEEI